MIIPSVLAVSLAAVLASSFLLIGPFSIDNILPAKNINYPQKAEAVVLPLVVRDHFTAMEMAGDAEAGSRFMTVNEDFVDPENHCEFCARVEYTPGPQGQAGFSYKDLKGLDLSSAKNVQFWVMGEEGGEKIKFKVAGKSLDKLKDKLGKLTDKLTKSIFKSERFALTTEEVTLDDDWKKYEVDLRGVDLRGITHPFAFELSKGNSAQKQVVYIKGVVYDEKPAEDPLTATAEELIEQLTANIISNGTKGVAPAAFKLESNITGGKEPYLFSWNFDDGEESHDKIVAISFSKAGTYNAALEVTDANGLTASDSLEIQVKEQKAAPEDIPLNQTARNSTQIP